MQAVCRPRHARMSPTRGCADGAMSPHPGFGVTLPRACCPPRNGSTNPPSPLFLELLVRWARCPASSPSAGSLPALCHLLLGPPPPPTWATSWGAPTGCPGAPCPDKGGSPRASRALGCHGQGLGQAPPHLYLLQRETIYREIYIFKLILKDLFLSLRPRPAAQGAGREGADPLPVQGCLMEAAGARDGDADVVHAPTPWDAGWPRAAHPLRHTALCLSFPTSEHGRAGDRGRAMAEPGSLLLPPHRQWFWGGGVFGVVLAVPSP